MSRLTSTQAIDLAEEFADAAELVREFRRANHDDLTTAQNKRLRSTTVTLTTLAQVVATEAVGLALSEATISLEGLNKATDQAKEAIGSIKDAKKVIEIAAATVSLAAAAISKDPNGVLKATQTLAKSVAQATEGDEEEAS